MYLFKIILFFFICNAAKSQQLQTNIPAHDPVMIKAKDKYYMFCTGRGINKWSSKDLINWQHEKPVFDSAPNWINGAVPAFKGNGFWAPDIAYFNGEYYLYYAVSTFGKNTSAIGLATNKTLDAEDSNYHWIDHGLVIASQQNKDRFNAIDPNFIIDENKEPWLTFGSWWGGLKLVKLDKGGKPETNNHTQLYSIASRNKSDFLMPDSLDAKGAIEAPFIYRENGYYYLFASFDLCCKAEKSTYKIAVGRSKKITGPYLDKSGIDMLHGGGTILLKGDADYYAVGHNAVCNFDGTDYIIYHAYDAHDNGKSKLKIKKLNWDKDGWPIVVELNN